MPTFSALTSFPGKKPSAVRMEIRARSKWEDVTHHTRKPRNERYQRSPRPVSIKISPIIHADENDRLTKVNRPSDKLTTIITVDVEIDVGRHRNKPKNTNVEEPPISKPPPKIHWNGVVTQVNIVALSKYEDTHK